MRAIKETKRLVKECDQDAKWYPVLAAVLVADIIMWIYMAITCGPVL